MPCNDESDEKRVSWKVIVVFTRHNCRLYTVGNKAVSCYESCLRIADENEVKSIAFCCISTGVFMFPNKRAAELAVQTVKQYKEKTKSKIKVIFNVFKEEDERLYNQLLR